jgi:hypothetical protein
MFYLGDMWRKAVWTGRLPSEPDDDVRYPHKCPGCGADCYLGLLRIEHRYPPNRCSLK